VYRGQRGDEIDCGRKSATKCPPARCPFSQLIHRQTHRTAYQGVYNCCCDPVAGALAFRTRGYGLGLCKTRARHPAAIPVLAAGQPGGSTRNVIFGYVDIDYSWSPPGRAVWSPDTSVRLRSCLKAAVRFFCASRLQHHASVPRCQRTAPSLRRPILNLMHWRRRRDGVLLV